MRTYNVGIIGFGFIGKVHAFCHHNLTYFYDPLPFRTRITHVCTGRPETAERARQFLGAEVGTTDYRAITENPAIDIVHICSPNHQHKAALLSAMAAGKAIYCDKPVVANLDEAADVEAALADYQGINQVTFHLRFFAATLRAAEIARSGRLGRILQFRAAFLHAGSANPDVPLKWKLTAAAGGGVVADLGSHAMDLVHAMVGDFAQVQAATSIAYADRPAPGEPGKRLPVDAEDLMLVTARLANGALGTIEATKLAAGTDFYLPEGTDIGIVESQGQGSRVAAYQAHLEGQFTAGMGFSDSFTNSDSSNRSVGEVQLQFWERDVRPERAMWAESLEDELIRPYVLAKLGGGATPPALRFEDLTPDNEVATMTALVPYLPYMAPSQLRRVFQDIGNPLGEGEEPRQPAPQAPSLFSRDLAAAAGVPRPVLRGSATARGDLQAEIRRLREEMRQALGL